MILMYSLCNRYTYYLMKENTNSIIAYNTIILYARLFVISICSLFTTRFALQALGVVDFGLFSVLGSIISFIAIFNTIMISTSNRFIAFALGKGDAYGANEQFNINLIIHLLIACITIIAAFPIGDWYIHNYVNFDGNIEDAVKVFRYTIIGSVISFLGVPYNGLLMAKERFIIFCTTDSVAHILKLIIAYLLIFMFVLLLALELLYFKIADHFNIIDKPNERSSHSTIVQRGGGVIFLLGVWLWCTFFGFHYPLFLAAVTLAAGVSFIDDVHSLPDSVRLVVQFAAMGLMIWQLMLVPTGGFEVLGSVWAKAAFVVVALIVCVGATNIYNFMDGINGITAGYSLAVLVPLFLVNQGVPFLEPSFLIVMLLAVLVFSFFNFRPCGKAKCFAGDVGSVGMAFIVLFAIGLLIVRTGDVTWLVFLLVYGTDGCCTIIHRIMLHENLGEAHRKHAYQLMANELKIGHVKVTLLYMAIQLAVSFGFVYLCPNTALCHWMYLIGALAVLVIAYVLFVKKYYHLHEEYLVSLKACSGNFSRERGNV